MVWIGIYTIFGFYLLIHGGNVVCKNSNIVALKAKISQLVIGMTLVAFSTSTPELFTSLIAVAKGKCDMVINNVIGSNFINIGLAGGLVALIRPFYIGEDIYKRDIPFLIFLTILVNIFCVTTHITCINGMLLLLLGTIYTYYIIKQQKHHNNNIESLNELSEDDKNTYTSIAILKVIYGIIILVVGSELVISGCCNIAHNCGISDVLISFTLLALGTSLPEIVTSLIAAIRGYGGICTGNIIGSNIFNIWMIIGSSALFKDLPSTEQLRFCDLPLSITYAILLFGFTYSSRVITRFKGLCLFVVFLIIFITLINLHLI